MTTYMFIDLYESMCWVLNFEIFAFARLTYVNADFSSSFFSATFLFLLLLH